MTINQIKLLIVAFFTLPLFIGVMSTLNNDVSAVSDPFYFSSFNDDSAAIYKKQCAMCHTAKAEKFFDTDKKDEELVAIILKGKQAAKPPHMPGYETKGINKDQAQNLVEYMRKLRNPEAADKETGDEDNAKAKARQETEEKSREAIIAVYKKNCVVCHTAKAEKFYNPEMKEDEQVQAILKGKKAEKPPHMPGYEAKGITEKEARALVAYMIELRTPSE